MIAPCRIDLELDKIAKTVSGKPAHFELITKDSLYNLVQGDLVLTTNGIIEEDMKYQLELGTFYALLEDSVTPQCFIKHKGTLTFAKGELASYRPSELYNKEPSFVRKSFVEPEFRSLEDYYRFTEIIQQQLMLKMVYD